MAEILAPSKIFHSGFNFFMILFVFFVSFVDRTVLPLYGLKARRIREE